MMYEPNKVTIELTSLANNLRQVKNIIGRHAKVMGVVKSDAYGHGLVPISRELEKNGVYALGVAHIHEALDLRENGIRVPIFILCGIRTREEASQIVERGLTPVLFDIGAAEMVSEESLRLDRRTGVHIKIDTGMGRLGIPHTETLHFVRKVRELKGLMLEGLVSHLSSADEKEGDFTDIQIRRFKEAIEAANSTGPALKLNSLENSAGILCRREISSDLVRPGIMLYGGRPSADYECSLPLSPVMHFRARVLQVRMLPDKTPVSYSRTYSTDGPKKIAVISAGYGDGLPRKMSNRGMAIVGGAKVPIIGRICMNLTICDITNLPETETIEEAVFLGSQGTETITGDEMAQWSETISYEIFCSIGQRHEKEYI